MASSERGSCRDGEPKSEASKVVEPIGLGLPSVACGFQAQIVDSNSISLSFDYERPNDESVVAIRETEQMIAGGSGEAYSTGRELLAAAMAQTSGCG